MIVTIRRLQNTDADMRTLLTWLTDERVLTHVYDEDAPWDLDKIRENFAENAEEDSDVAGWMILADGQPVGYMQHYAITEESYRFTAEVPYSLLAGAYGTDMFIGVPEMWRMGIGRRAVELLAEVLRARGVTRLCADPCTENDHGMAFWPKAGFVPLGMVAEYDHPEKKSMLMVKALNTDFASQYSKFFSSLGDGRHMVLSTAQNDQVSSRMMSIVQMDGLFYFQTDKKFRKYAQLIANPRAALCIDNIQIEGMCQEIGHPSDHKTFCEAYRRCFAGSYERYSSLPDERLFVLIPAYVERWVYQNSIPYMEILDFANQRYQFIEYQGV